MLYSNKKVILPKWKEGKVKWTTFKVNDFSGSGQLDVRFIWRRRRLFGTVERNFILANSITELLSFMNR